MNIILKSHMLNSWLNYELGVLGVPSLVSSVSGMGSGSIVRQENGTWVGPKLVTINYVWTEVDLGTGHLGFRGIVRIKPTKQNPSCCPRPFHLYCKSRANALCHTNWGFSSSQTINRYGNSRWNSLLENPISVSLSSVRHVLVRNSRTL